MTHSKSFPGNALPFPPYLGGPEVFVAALAGDHLIDCESVGTVYMLCAAAALGPLPFRTWNESMWEMHACMIMMVYDAIYIMRCTF